jgi:hypothetical protein
MKDSKVIIESIEASDASALTAIQKKINQWITVGLLRKYTVNTTNSHIIFNICIRKKA